MPAIRLLAAASLGACLGLVGVGAESANAATLRLSGGGHVTATQVGQMFLPGGLGASGGSFSGSFGGGITYVVSEASGRSLTGIVPGTRSLSLGEPSLAQNPLTREIFIVFAVRASSGSQIVFSSWVDGSWTPPQALTQGTGSDSRPALSFGATGEAILAWQHDDFLPTILVRHFELAPSGPIVNYSFSDLGSPMDLVRPAGGAVGLASGIAHVVTDSDRRHSYMFLADAERESVGLVRLDLQALFQGGGFNAPPVPVALISPTPQAAGEAGQSLGGRSDAPGSLIVPWRISLSPDTFAYYWTETDRLSLVMFRGGTGGALVSAPLPDGEAQFHATAYGMALRELGLVERRGIERTLQRQR